jgi:hypothetical protein
MRSRERPAALVVDLDAGPQTLKWARDRLRRRRWTVREVRPLAADSVGALEEHYDENWIGVAVCAASYAVLREALCLLPSFGAATHVTICVEESPSSVRRLGPRRLMYPALAAATATDSAPQGPSTQLSFDFAAPSSLHRIVADHVLLGAHPYLDVPVRALRVAVADVAASRWLAGDPTARTITNSGHTWFSDNDALVPYDLVLSTADAPPSAAAPVVAVAAGCPPVDIEVVNPGGFRTDTHGTPASLVRVGDDVLQVRRDEQLSLDIDPRRGLSAKQIATLRYVPYVDVTPLVAMAPPVGAGLLVQLAAAAVPMLVGALPAPVWALLDLVLVRELEVVDAATLESPERREAAALRVRRPALAHHSVQAVLSGLSGGSPRQPQVSALLVSRRTEFLSHALAALRAQTHRELEVVVALHGVPAPADLADALAAFASSVVLEEPAEAVFGAVLNRATDAANGTYLAKIDDDDWYGPHHVEDMLAALRWSGAQLVGALDEFVYLAHRDVTVRRHDFHRTEKVAGRVAGPTMLLRREDLVAVGGWRAAPSAVDHSLVHNLRDAGATIFRTHALGFVLCRHGRGHTWNPGDDRFVESSLQQWDGFHAPPALGDPDVALARLAAVRALGGAAQPASAGEP